jgi:hypothetical protein
MAAWCASVAIRGRVACFDDSATSISSTQLTRVLRTNDSTCTSATCITCLGYTTTCTQCTSKLSTAAKLRPLFCAALTIVCPTGCSLPRSHAAASLSTACAPQLRAAPKATSSVSTGLPVHSVHTVCIVDYIAELKEQYNVSGNTSDKALRVYRSDCNKLV